VNEGITVDCRTLDYSVTEVETLAPRHGQAAEEAPVIQSGALLRIPGKSSRKFIREPDRGCGRHPVEDKRESSPRRRNSSRREHRGWRSARRSRHRA